MAAVVRYKLDDIYVGPRLRTGLGEEQIKLLADSMTKLGLMTPITVWFGERPNEDGEIEVGPNLIAGRHRLEAARRLGWEYIDCREVKLSADECELWQIDENLARAELTTEEKREHLRRRKELWERREIQVAHDAPSEIGFKKPPPQVKGFAAETAAATGLSKSQINRLLADPKPRAPAKPAKIAREPLNEFEVVQHQVDALMAAWNKASTEAREQFLARIDRPVFDATGAGRAA